MQKLIFKNLFFSFFPFDYNFEVIKNIFFFFKLHYKSAFSSFSFEKIKFVTTVKQFNVLSFFLSLSHFPSLCNDRPEILFFVLVKNLISMTFHNHRDAHCVPNHRLIYQDCIRVHLHIGISVVFQKCICNTVKRKILFSKKYLDKSS